MEGSIILRLPDETPCGYFFGPRREKARGTDSNTWDQPVIRVTRGEN